jgi:sec-independent protein translocase protein TatA
MHLGWPEILLILVIVLVVFGVGRLPQTMRDIGRGVREFRKEQQGYDEEKKEVSNTTATAKGINDSKTN